MRVPWPVVGFSAGPLVGVGLARFAYALLLPPMRDALGWSYAQAGALGTANAVGYLAGAVVAAPLAARIGTERALPGALLVTAASLAGCAVTAAFPLLVALRLAAGAAGAVAFVVAASLAARAGADGPARRAAVLVGICVAGAGVGILLSGLALPPLLAALGPDRGWRAGWLLLGVLALLAVPPAVAAQRRAPASGAPPARSRGGWPRRPLAATAGAYSLFGAGYIAYATFAVAGFREQGLGPGEVAAFWCALGAAAVVASVLAAPVLGAARGGRGLAALMAVLAVAAAVPLVVRGPLAAYASGALFGSCVLSTATAVTLVARRLVAPERWSAAIGGLTVGFALGQCLGPLLAGVLSDGADGVRGGLLLSVALLAAGSVLALAQRDGRAGT